MDLELRHLRAVVAVAEERHFTRAALRLGIAQPALSQQIRRIEDLLGVALFVRTSRRVTVTEAGQAVVEEARRTLEHAARTVEAAALAARGEVGRLAVGFLGSAMIEILPGAIRAFRAAYPRVDLTL